MQISDLARESDVPVATLKYYLREGLLHPGHVTARTRATYDATHLERVRLVRSLTVVGGLSLAAVKRVLAAIDAPVDRFHVISTAAMALDAGGREDATPATGPSRARDWAAARGWQVHPADPVLDDLDRAWAACDAAGLGLDDQRLDAYADAMEQVAEVDVASVPAEPASAVRQVVLGTVLVDPVLAALRRLAQQHLTVSRRHD